MEASKAFLILEKPIQYPLWDEINDELDARITNVSATDMPYIIMQRLIGKLYSNKNGMWVREGKMKGENETVSLVNLSFLKKDLGIVAIALIAAIMVMPGMAQTPPEEEWNSIFAEPAWMKVILSIRPRMAGTL